MINVSTYAKVANSLLRVYQGYTKGIRFLLVLFLTLTVSANVWGADVTVKWTASSGALGSNIGSGTIKTGTFSWDYTRTLKSGSSYTGWSSNCIQLGKNGGVENIIFTTSAIPGTIKKVSIECASYQGKHNVAITVGGKSYLSSTATSSWTTVSAKSGSGTSSGTIQISLTGGTRALYIKSISVTYEEAAATVPVTGVSLNESTLTLTEGDSETLTATIAPANATDKTVTWSTSDANIATVSNGKVTAVAEGTAKVTVTTTDGGKTATCNVTVNPKPTYTVTWDVNGDQSVTTQVTEGSKPTFPATPSSCDATSNTFYGWTTATWDGKIDNISEKTIYTSANNMPAVNGAVTYYAVFATKETSGSGTAGWSKVTSTSDLEVGATYAISSAETAGNYLSTYTGANNFPNSTTTICKLVLGGSADAWTFKINDASSYNNYYLTATSTTGSNYLKATSTIDNYCKFSISFANTGNAVITCTGKQSRNILRYNSTNNPPIFACYSSGQSAVYLQKYSTGSTTTYSDYITTCSTEPSQLATPTGLNVTNITSTSATLSWGEVANASGYKVTVVDGDSYNKTISVEENNTSITLDDLTQSTAYSWTVIAIGDVTNYTNSESATSGFTTQKACTDAVNVYKGTPSNGSFTMVTGFQSTCNGPLTVTLSNIEPATRYQFKEITQSGVIAANVTIDNTAKTVTYAQNTTGTSTINVTFTPKVYTITYKDQGNAAFSGTHEEGYPTTHTYNTATTLKSASKDHYTFDGWYKESDCSGTAVTTLGATEYTDNITLYAKWTANTYTITLDANGGTFVDKRDSQTKGSATFDYIYGTYANYNDAPNLTEYYSDLKRDGYQFDKWVSAGSPWNKLFTSTGDRTIQAQWSKLYTITLSENGTTNELAPQASTTYKLPTELTAGSCQDDTKELVGWSTEEIPNPGDKPTSNFYELGATVTLTADQTTFYAVFATKGGIPSTDYNQITSIEDLTDGNYVIAYGYNTTSPTIILKAETKDETTLVATSAGPTDNKYTDPAASNIWEIKKTNTTYTLYNAATSKYIQATNTPSLKLADANPTEFQISYSTDHWKIKLNTANTYQLVGYTNASGNYFQTKASPSGSYKIQLYKSASTVVYTAYTTSCVASYSITYDFAGGTGSHCSNTSVPQGNTYTICDDAPTREGHTFQGWSDGTSTYAAGATITPTSDITLTAVWKANTYTVTWNNNSDTDEVTYNHGDALVVPTAPASCDGVKEFVGWTTHSGYYHATTAPDDIFTTKTTPVTATATYYAVFATPGAGGTEFVLGESGTFKMYANVDGTNHYAQGGVSSSKLSSTTDILTASDYTLTHKGSNQYTIQIGNSYIGHTKSSSTDLNTEKTTWTITEGVNGSWRIVSPVNASRALVYRTSTYNIFKAYSTASLEAGNTEYFDIEFGSGSDAHSDYTTICQTVEKIEIANYTTEFFVTDEFAFGGTVTAHFDGGGTQDVTALAHFSGYNMNVTGTYTVTVTYMGATATYEINVKPLDNAWVLTWNVSGKTNTGLGPRSVIKGSAIGTLPVPKVPAACAGKTFMGWTESNVVPSDGVGIVYITEETKPTDNTTYYAVFATVNNFCTQKPINQIASGSKVVIVAVASLDAGGTTGKAISSRTAADGNNLASDDVFVLDEQINTPHSTCVWTLTREVSGKYIFTQDGKYLNAIVDPDKTTSGFCKFNSTKDTWTISESSTNTYRMLSSNQNKYVEWFTATGVFKVFNVANTFGTFDMQFFVTANANGGADITDYTTGCAEYTITYYGFRGGYSTSSSSDGTIVLPVNSLHTVPDCGDVVKDHTNLGREFLNVWMTKPHGGHTFKPGDTFILTQDTTLYAQWKLETNSDLTTLPTDIEDLAGTDVYVYGGKTLNIQPGTTTINSLTLKGGIQTDGSYQMPSVWVPEGATLVRNSNKIYLDLVVNAKTWYPFAVPFETKNTSDIHYLHPDMKSAATYSKHFDIKTYDGARRADVGEDKANNWVRLKRHTAEEPVSFKPGVGYIISAMAYPGTDTATIRIPMSVPNTWFKNGEQAVVGTTVRNTIDVTAHTGEAATEHQRHAGWNFVANPYLSYFTGGGIDATNGLEYIDGELIIQGGYEYSEETVPYVTIPAYNFAYYSQHKLSDVKLSPEYSFFVQIGTSGTMNFTTEGRQQAPAALRSNMDNPRIETDIVISHNQQTADHTGLIIDDRYTTAYEIGADLEKMFGSAYNTTIYTLGNDVRLAYNALSHIEATIPIPLGFRAETDGEYTISLTNPEDILTVESIVLQDSYNNTTTNLLLNDYTFYTDRTQDDQRFVVYIVPHNNAPTDISTIIDNDTETRKVIHNHRLYIIHNGHVYDGVGQTIQ